LPEKGGGHFGKDAKCRQDQNVDFGMAPDPEQIHIHHRVAAGVHGEEVKAKVAIKK